MAYPLFLARLFIRSGIARLLPAVKRWTDGGTAFLRHYSDRLLVSPHRELRALQEFLELPGPDAIDLALGAPRFDLVPSCSSKLPADRRGWPPIRGVPELCHAVAERLKTDDRVSVDGDSEVLITHGATGALHVALDAFMNAGDRVVLFEPTSPLFTLALQSRRARVRWVSTIVEEGRLRFRLNHFARAMRGARLVIINSPNNPTGGVIASEDLEQIAWWADRRDVLIVNDEVFAPYHYDGRPVSIATLPRAARRTLTIGSISKEFALASARVGWLAGHRHLIGPCTVMAALHTPFVPTLCQQIAMTALTQGNATFDSIRCQFASKRDYVFERLCSVGLKPERPAGGFFLWVPIGELATTGREFARQLLRERNVLVSPGDLFGPHGEKHIRVSYAAEDGRLREGVSRLIDFVRGKLKEGQDRMNHAA